MKESFDDWTPRKAETQALILKCAEIIEEYTEQRLVLTLRQLFYQCVTRMIVPNTERAYKNLGVTVSKARVAGYLDWGAIEDRGRQPKIPSEFENLTELVEAALRSYRLDRWAGQQYYAELWVEKDALASVLAPLAREFHVPLMVNKGYSSQSAMYASAKRIMFGCEVDERHRSHLDERPAKIMYLGDHDPSGQDMVRDIQRRLNLYTRDAYDIHVQTVALTTAQVREYDPPPNPTKLKDPRAEKYIELHGYECWEVDALDPSTLQSLIRFEFEHIIDITMMDKIKEQEVRDKKTLRDAVLSRGLV